MFLRETRSRYLYCTVQSPLASTHFMLNTCHKTISRKIQAIPPQEPVVYPNIDQTKKTKNDGKFYFHSILPPMPPESIVTRLEREGGKIKKMAKTKQENVQNDSCFLPKWNDSGSNRSPTMRSKKVAWFVASSLSQELTKHCVVTGPA